MSSMLVWDEILENTQKGFGLSLYSWGGTIIRSGFITCLIDGAIKQEKKVCFFPCDQSADLYRKIFASSNNKIKENLIIMDNFDDATAIFDEIFEMSNEGYDYFIIENETLIEVGDLPSIWYENLKTLAKQSKVNIVMLKD